MLRLTWWALAVVLALAAAGGPGRTSPVDGPFREVSSGSKRQVYRLLPNSKATFTRKFQGNERAAVIVEGDHEPVVKLAMVVKDAAGNIVGKDSGGDLLAVIWYPPVTQEYTIQVFPDPADNKMAEYNDLDIVLK
jgi:hypothetical protein